MQNNDIDEFFNDADLSDLVERSEHLPNVIWQFHGQGFPMFIQTQESADRLRIVAFVAEANGLDAQDLGLLLEANYHSALDARYALTDGNVVSVFLHPFEELSVVGFISGLYQVINCAETCGTTFSGGTMVFGATPEPGEIPGGDGASLLDDSGPNLMTEVVRMIRGE